MSNTICIFGENSKERKRLEAAANFIQAETGKICIVNDIMFDVSQNWPWTTISIESGLNTFPFVQALDPKQQEKITIGSSSEWMEVVQEVIANQFKKGR